MKDRGKSNKRISKLAMTGTGMTVLLVSIAFAFLAVTPVMAQEAEVTVNAPEYVGKGETFDVTIDVEGITDFNNGMFDLIFDHKVVEVKKVTDGSIDDTKIPIAMWASMDSDTIKVMLELSGDTTVSGSGYLAKVSFKVKGKDGDESALEISDGELVKYVFEDDRATPEAIGANWNDAKITVGAKEEEKEEEEEPQGITAWEPTEAAVSSTEGEPITFEITVDQKVDISWQINGTKVQTDEDVTGAIYTNTSAVAGTWNISAIAISTETGLSTMHTWIWSVASTEALEVTSTPTPTLAPGETPVPTPTLAPGETPKPTATSAIKPTSKPTAPPTTEGKPTPTPTPKSAVPGFNAVLAIAVISAIAYILLRRRRSDDE